MNISPQNIAGICNLKCAFSFNYNVSKCTATNYGQYIQLTYEASSTPQVTFNTVPYNVKEIKIFTPSIHSYNNAKADAEIIITHIPINGGNSFNVCIPINTNNPTTTGSQIISEIISAVSSNAPSQGTSTNQGIKEFSLNDIVPMKPFYSYSDPKNEDVIVYGIQHAVSISNNSLNTLKKCIQANAINLPAGPSLFSNPDGPSNGNVGDGSIYIDCQPTNSSEEEVNMVTDLKSPVTYDAGSYIYLIITNPVFLLLCASVIFIVILMVVHWVINYISEEGDDLPLLPSLSKGK